MRERVGVAVMDWAATIPADQIPCVMAFLLARLLAEGGAGHHGEHNVPKPRDSEKLLAAGELAALLNLPESWVRTE
jgi:hypothetical protein